MRRYPWMEGLSRGAPLLKDMPDSQATNTLNWMSWGYIWKRSG
ncbi:hypothetical protein HPTD01_2502 [Halomonas sp. TD01]|nr:hypothetical protein HPTD01_2502 [Halomonas sp. TD01]